MEQDIKVFLGNIIDHDIKIIKDPMSEGTCIVNVSILSEFFT